MNDLLWISPALLAGVAASRLGLPPMVGYLLCGFALNITGVYDHERLSMIGDLGVTLLLFTVGLKLDLRSLSRSPIWAGTTTHTLLVTAFFSLLLQGLSLAGFWSLDAGTATLIGFALSFSSTVFAVKMLEDKGDYQSNYGMTAIGVLIMQDIFAVIFLAASTGVWPSIWALLLLGLYPGRHLLARLLDHAGRSGELQILYGIALSYGSYALFTAVDVKGDLGALVVGALLSGHPMAAAVSHRLLGFKDLLLVGFFLSIGMSGHITLSTILAACFLSLLVVVKVALFFFLFTRFRMRARTSALSALTLANYSEFGLIVATVSVSNNWLSPDWLVTLALALTCTIVLAAPLNLAANRLYDRWRGTFEHFESETRLPEDEPPNLQDAEIIVIGMGRLGSAVYEQLLEGGYRPIGVDIDPEVVARHKVAGFWVIQADATDHEFWESTASSALKTGIVAFKRQRENLCIVKRARDRNPSMEMFAVADHRDEVAELKANGAKAAWNLYSEAGIGVASHVVTSLKGQKT